MRQRVLIFSVFLGLISVFAFPNASFSQAYGTVLLLDYDDPTLSLEGVSVYSGTELLGITDHVGSFKLPRKVKGELTFSHPNYESKKVPFKSKANRTVEVNLMMTTERYNALKKESERRIYATCSSDSLSQSYLHTEQTEELSAGFTEYLNSYMRYPNRARDNKEQGTVEAQLFIEADGTVSCIQLTKRVSFELDQEAFRLLSAMPAWKPARKNGVPVASSYHIRIPFKLSK